jgi:hypothetical protein
VLDISLKATRSIQQGKRSATRRYPLLIGAAGCQGPRWRLLAHGDWLVLCCRLRTPNLHCLVEETASESVVSLSRVRPTRGIFQAVFVFASS